METNRVVGLDLGSGFTKCFDGVGKIIFPSIYSYRQPTIWEDKSGIIEGVGEQAIEIAKYPNAITLRPIVEGKPQHQASIKLEEEALNRARVDPSSVFLVTGLPYETARGEKERVRQVLMKSLGLHSVDVYPQCVGTMFDLDLESGTVINVGHGTTEILAVERFTIITGVSLRLASDFVLESIAEYVQAKYGFKPSMQSILDLVVRNVGRISTFGNPTVSREEIKTPLKDSVSQAVEKLSYETRCVLTRLSTSMECVNQVVLSGGGALITGMREGIQENLRAKMIVPEDPIFSNVRGFYKMGRERYGERGS